MASGVIYGTTDNQYIEAALAWAATGDAANNWSDVWVTLRLKKSSQSSSATSGTGYFNLQVDGTGANAVNIGSITIPRDDVWRDYYSWHFTNVAHGADGARAMAMTLVNNSPSASYSGLPGTSFTECYVSGTAAFDTLLLAPTAPGAPSLTRVSDVQQNLSWANNAATRAPYAYQVVQRWDNVSNTWYSITGALSGAATAYSDTTTAADREYKYRVVAVNNAGSATGAASSSIYTTPAAPTNAVATKAVSDIVLTWNDNSSAEEGFKVYESQNGGAYSLLATVGAGVATYTHVAPSAAVTHAYQVEAYRGALASARATSNTVVLLTNPLAPTLLAIASVFDAAAERTLTWQHNPVDGTAQTAAEIQYREVGAAAWIPVVPATPKLNAAATMTIATPCVVTKTAHGLSTGDPVRFTTTGALPTGLAANTWYWAIRVTADTFNLATTYANAIAGTKIATSGSQSGTHTVTGAMGTQTASSRTFAAAFFTNNKSYEAQVRTMGQYATVPAYSPWSSSATYLTSATPTCVISSPADAATVTTPSVTVAWAYFDAEGTAQAARKVTLYDAAGTTALWTEEVSDAATSRVIPYALADGVAYKIGVMLRDGAGLWSVEDIHSIAVDYLEPMTPTLVVTFDEATASATIAVTNPEPTGGRPIVTNNKVYRVVGGVSELVAGNVAGNGSCIDATPVIGGTTGYYVEGYSALPSMAVSATAELVVASGAYCHFNWGSGYSQHARLASNLSFANDIAPDQRYYQFAGAALPTLFTGEARSHAITCSAEVHDDATAEAAFEALADWGGPVIYRDVRGHRVLVGAKVKMSEGAGPRITRVDVEMRRISA